MTSASVGRLQAAREVIDQALRDHDSTGHCLNLPLADHIHLELHRLDGCVTLTAESQVGRRMDDATVMHACRLALPSLLHYRAVVLMDERNNRLRWIRSGLRPQVSAVERALEQLLNQVDVWEQMLLQGHVLMGAR